MSAQPSKSDLGLFGYKPGETFSHNSLRGRRNRRAHKLHSDQAGASANNTEFQAMNEAYQRLDHFAQRHTPRTKPETAQTTAETKPKADSNHRPRTKPEGAQTQQSAAQQAETKSDPSTKTSPFQIAGEVATSSNKSDAGNGRERSTWSYGDSYSSPRRERTHSQHPRSTVYNDYSMPNYTESFASYGRQTTGGQNSGIKLYVLTELGIAFGRVGNGNWLVLKADELAGKPVFNAYILNTPQFITFLNLVVAQTGSRSTSDSFNFTRQ